MSLFLKATQSSWYREFLKPVAETILVDTGGKKILDIGTGPGKLPEMLHALDAGLVITGIDINASMINEARRNLKAGTISFLYQKRDVPLEFEDNGFDVVTLCSVLFLVEDQTKSQLLQESLRVLRPGGRVIILTPSGRKSVFSAFPEAKTFPPSAYRWTFPVWRMATSYGGRKWQRQSWLKQYSDNQNLGYSTFMVFNNNATIEIITKPITINN